MKTAKFAALMLALVCLGSHAAVVGLSLNKAVIVGAIGATRTLHDGMKVSMDCRQGSVQSLAE